MDSKKAATIDQYISDFDPEIRDILEKIRQIIKKAAPEAEEAIKYQMPTFVLNGKNLIHFAAFQHHIGLYPTPHGIDAFPTELKKYKTSKGAIQLPLDQPIPYDLISKIVKFRVQEVSAKKKAPLA